MRVRAAGSFLRTPRRRPCAAATTRDSSPSASALQAASAARAPGNDPAEAEKHPAHDAERCRDHLHVGERTPVHAATASDPAGAGATLRGTALLAQLVEHLHGKEGVDGSSPSEGSAKVLETGLFFSAVLA